MSNDNNKIPSGITHKRECLKDFTINRPVTKDVMHARYPKMMNTRNERIRATTASRAHLLPSLLKKLMDIERD